MHASSPLNGPEFTDKSPVPKEGPLYQLQDIALADSLFGKCLYWDKLNKNEFLSAKHDYSSSSGDDH